MYEKSPHSENDHWVHDRDQLLIQMMWITGARITDVLDMRTDKINFNNRSITFLVRKRKNTKRADGQWWHTITIDMETLNEIMNYIHTWNVRGLLFPSYRNSDKQLTRQAVALKLKSLAETIGMTRNIHCHLWRHGVAMFLQAQGIPIELVSYHLAHSSTTITLSTYATLDALQERKIFDSLGVRLR